MPDAAPILQAGSVNGESVAKTLADHGTPAGVTGAGVNVGIIDVFDGPALWNAAVATATCPTSTSANDTFCRSQGAVCNVRNGGSLHGVAVAEIVHDMAPGAELFLVYAETTSDLRAAVDWMASKGVTVVNRSHGRARSTVRATAPARWPTSPPTPSAKGITWFNSAGNAAGGGYWRGALVRPRRRRLPELQRRRRAARGARVTPAPSRSGSGGATGARPRRAPTTTSTSTSTATA